MQRLLELGYPYPTMVPRDRATLAVDNLKRALDNITLSRDLSALQCETMDNVVEASEEYFEVSGQPFRLWQTITIVGRAQRKTC